MSVTTTAPPAAQAPRPDSPAGPRRWWQRPWVVPLAFLSVVFVAFSLPPYLSLDPAQSRVPQPEGFPLHFPLLSLHVVFGSVAILTCCLQVWPWLRQRHPKVHRISGRLYVFAGVLPSALLALVIGARTPFGPVAAVSGVMLATLWLLFTVAGYRMARQGRYADHRKWMIRSFALTIGIITNRLWGAVCFLVLSPQVDTTFGGSEEAMAQASAGITTWFSWVTMLLVAQWWLERKPAKPATGTLKVGPVYPPATP